VRLGVRRLFRCLPLVRAHLRDLRAERVQLLRHGLALQAARALHRGQGGDERLGLRIDGGGEVVSRGTLRELQRQLLQLFPVGLFTHEGGNLGK
jgi:hypothetical protein